MIIYDINLRKYLICGNLIIMHLWTIFSSCGINEVNVFHDNPFSIKDSSQQSAREDILVTKWQEFQAFLAEHEYRIGSLVFSPDNKNLVSVEEFHEIIVHSVINSQKNLKILRQKGRGEAVAFSSDGKLVAISYENGKIKLYDATTYTEYKLLIEPDKKRVSALSFSPDNKILAAAYNPFAIILWDVIKGEKLLSIPQENRITNVLFISFTPDMRNLIVIGNIDWILSAPDYCPELGKIALEEELKIWTGLVLQSYEIKTQKWKKPVIICDNIIFCDNVAVNFNMTPRLLAFTESRLIRVQTLDFEQSRFIKIINVDTGEEIRTLIHNSPDISALTINPTATLLVSAHKDGKIRFWDIASNKEIGIVSWDGVSYITSLAFSNNGGILAAADEKRRIKLYRNPEILIGWLLKQKIEPPTSEEHAEIQKLYQQLASEDPQTREEATQRLIEMGKKVVPVIKEGLNSDDLELKVRVKHILTEIATRGE